MDKESNQVTFSVPRHDAINRYFSLLQTYSVVDHFDLSRETVAISLSLFDRYCATLGNQCDGSIALLTSLTTLSVAVKINETKSIHLRTLADLSRSECFLCPACKFYCSEYT